MSVYVKNIGSMPCAVCGEMMSQTDVDNQDAIISGLSRNQSATIIVIAHVRHFYLREKNNAQTANYELNMAKFSLAVGRANKEIWSPEAEKRALAKIAKLEKKYERN